MERLLTESSLANEVRSAKFESRTKKAAPSNFFVRTSNFELRTSPADMYLFRLRPMQPRELFLLLLLHRTEKRLDVGILFLLLVRRGLRLLRIGLRRSSF